MPSSNGMTNALAMAALGALASCDGSLNGKKIYNGGASMFDQIEKTASEYMDDEFMLTRVEFTQGGFAKFKAQDKDETVCYGWGGAGGTMIRYVPSLDLAIGYCTNKLGFRMAMNDPRPNLLLKAAIECAKAVSNSEK
eukprot:TRINITY_DN673_c0_g1_i4.p2 TRINITY_DN673_c0_g1~~TRINITY_DN673_c0_g1_i4.p2  ORF type:complete len:138 (-),score=29.86 TRINITY_DN673_c0_g1_i4:79-492(-)